MGITYNVANNRIDIDGYSEETPATFQDIYDADKAGTFELLDGTIDADPDTFSLDDAVRPADSLAVQLDITCTARVGATCDITGEDAWGNALTESGIDISSGSATTTEYFSSVDASGITVDGMTNSDDFDIAQGQWGVVWLQGGNQFYFEAVIVVGSGGWGAAAWFADTDKQVLFSSALSARLIKVEGNNNKHFTLGILNDAGEKRVSNGCSIISLSATADLNLIGSWGVTIVGASHLSAPNADSVQSHTLGFSEGSGGDVSFYHNILASGIRLDICHGDWYDCYFTASPSGIANSSADFDDIKIDDCNYGLIIYQAFGGTVANSVILGPGTSDLQALNATVDGNLIDCTLGWTITWSGSSSAVFNRKHTFNLKVIDGDGNAIQNATVSMVDKDGNAVFSVTTDASGDIAEQTILYGYYDQANGNTIQPAGSNSPHVVTISKPGYAPRTIVYTMDRPHVEVEVLGSAAPFGAEYRRRRVPAYVSEMVE